MDFLQYSVTSSGSMVTRKEQDRHIEEYNWDVCEPSISIGCSGISAHQFSREVYEMIDDMDGFMGHTPFSCTPHPRDLTSAQARYSLHSDHFVRGYRWQWRSSTHGPYMLPGMLNQVMIHFLSPRRVAVPPRSATRIHRSSISSFIGFAFCRTGKLSYGKHWT